MNTPKKKVPDTDTHVQKLKAAIEDSGLPTYHFATYVLARNESSVRTWLKAKQKIPTVVAKWLDNWTTLSDSTRRRIVGALVPKPEPENTLATKLAKASKTY